ncbi:MAG: hypothetical protein HY822_21590 [Acidobacteria bacterium]|nr:hypothetical protein [Acidobacteriota bacterium]
MQTGKSQTFMCAVFGALLLSTSCSKGPEPPKPGSPAFNWAVARESYKKGDIVKTNATLEQLLRGKHEFTARALPWKIAVASGMTRGYMEMADKYETGSKASRTDSGSFRKQMTVFRTQARSIAMQSAEAVNQYLSVPKEASVTLVFPFPEGDLDESASLKKVVTGMPLQQAETEKITLEMIQRGVVQFVCRAAGAPKDLEKARALFSKEETSIPSGQFLMAVAQTMYEISDLYTPKKMDEPDKQKIFCDQALKALEGVPASKEKKDLDGKIQAALKKIRGNR